MDNFLIPQSINAMFSLAAKYPLSFTRYGWAEAIYSSNCPNPWREVSAFSDYPKFGPCPFLTKIAEIPLLT